ncbi:recombinase family protein [Amycolatopsis sp. NPDC004368]
MTTRVLIYCRISADPTGRAAGVSRQEKECRELAEHLGWTVVEGVLAPDNDISAYSGKRRPQYRLMLEELKAGRADAVLAWHPDRLYRRLVELEEFIDIVNTHHIAVRTVKAGEMDLSTPTGRAMARTAAVWSGHEVEHGIERMRAAKSEAAAEGVWRGGPRPFGFEADGVTVRPDEAAAIADATRRLLAGEGTGSIVLDWNRSGIVTSRGGKWNRRSFGHMIVRARNAGMVGGRDGKFISNAVWPAIVSEHELSAVRALLADPARKLNGDYRGGRVHLGTGLYQCGVCLDGTTMIRGGSGGSYGKPYPGTYKCRAFNHCSRALAPVDQYVSDVMVEILQKPHTRLRIYDVPEEDIAALQAEANAIREDLEGLRHALGARQITLRDFTVASGGMNADLEKVEAKLAASAARSPLSGVADADDVEAAWGAATLGRKRAIVDALATVTLKPGQRGRLPGGAYFSTDSVVIIPK